MSAAITFTAHERDKLHAEARNAWLGEAFVKHNHTPATIYDSRTGEEIAWKPSARKGLASPMKLVAALLESAGMPRYQVDALPPTELARLACSPPNMMGGPLASGSHYNVSGMFQSLTTDVANVLVRQSYNEAKTTFQLWAARLDPLKDFREASAVIAGGVGDPQAISEDGEFAETTLVDGKEKIQLAIWGHVLSVTFQLVMNDRSSVFTDPAIRMTRSVRRKQNRLVYSVLKDNKAMSDGIALFHASAVGSGGHNNQTTGAITDYNVSVGTMTKKMAEQKGIGQDDSALNLSARFAIFPPALQNKISTLITSRAVPGGTNDTTNIYQGQFEPIMEAELGAAFGGSDSAFYLAADPMDVETVGYAYLAGFENPVVETQASFDRLGFRQRIYQPFAAKAIDYRGLQQHTGA